MFPRTASTSVVPALATAWLHIMNRLRCDSIGSLVTALGFFVYLMATRPAPPGTHVQTAFPQALPVATQSKDWPIFVEKFGTCHEPE